MLSVDNVKVKLKFKDGQELVVDSSDRLTAYNLLLELDSSIENVVSSVSSNELSIGLNNSDDIFTPTNTASPYYNMLDESIKIELLDGVTVFGKFNVVDWSVANNGGIKKVSIRAVDNLQNVLNSPVVLNDLDTDILLRDFLTKVFLNVGLTVDDFDIDSSINMRLNFGISSGDKLANILNDVSLSADCYIYINDVGKLVVKNKAIDGVAVHTLSDDTNLTSIQIPKKMAHNCNSLKINYVTSAITEVQEILNISQLPLSVGINKVQNYKFFKPNIYDIDNIRVSCVNEVEILGMISSQSDISMTLNHTGSSSVKADISVFGRAVENRETYVLIEDADSIQDNGRKELSLNSKLIQTTEDANWLLARLWTRATMQQPFVQATVQLDDFSYKLGDICTVVSTEDNLNYKGYIHSINYKWLGGNVIRAEVGVKGIPVE
jgi:hypothetical protein